MSACKTEGAPALANAEITSKFSQGDPYGDIREVLIQNGWSPVILSTSDTCMDGDVRCTDRPEMESCSDIDTAPCKFVWMKGKQRINIFTQGVDATPKGDASFDSFELYIEK